MEQTPKQPQALTLIQPGQDRKIEIFSGADAFATGQRMAQLLATSDMVPKAYVGKMQNCLVALEIANRAGISPLMVMQNLHVIEGRPSWSSTFIIASLNSCGKFEALKFKMTKGEKKTYEYTWYEWVKQPNGGKDKREARKGTAVAREMTCVAWTREKATGEIIEGPEVTMQMAVEEGWFTKPGSKWKTMPELMIQYRAAAFFGRLYAPEIAMGMRTAEEEQDIIEVESTVVETKPASASNQAAAAAGVINEKIRNKKATKSQASEEKKAEAKEEPVDASFKEVDEKPAQQPDPEPQAEAAKPEQEGEVHL